MKPVKLSLEKDEAKESNRDSVRRVGGGTEKWRMKERERERERAASERTVKPPFETNRLEDEFESWL